jgi:hypothetical protein
LLSENLTIYTCPEAVVFDSILLVVLVLLPVASGIAILVASSRQRTDRKQPIRHRYAIGVVLIIFGILILIQQYRATITSQKEREKTIREISDRVAAKAGEALTKAIDEQHRQMMATISRINKQLQTLQAQASLSRSSRANGATPLTKGETNNAGAATTSTNLLGPEDIRLSWRRESSIHMDTPYAAIVTIDADAPVNPVRLAITSDVPLKSVEAISGPSAFDGNSSIHQADPHIFLINMSTSGPAPLRPDAPLVFNLYSDQPIKIVKFERSLR